MEKNTFGKKIMLFIDAALVLVLLILVIGVCTGRLFNPLKAKQAEASTQANSGEQEKLFAKAGQKEEVITISTEVIEDGIREMGFLITEEYFFTMMEEYSKADKFLFISTEASCMFSYDGSVPAGIDCTKITVTKDDEQKVVTITIPQAELRPVNIDPNSFVLYEEKNGIWNKITMTDYNASLIELENKAREKAIEKGVLDKAGESAQKMIQNFVNNFVDTKEYKVEFKVEGRN